MNRSSESMVRLDLGDGLTLEVPESQVERLCGQLGIRRASTGPPALLTTAEAAALLNVSEEYMRDNASRYGGEKHAGKWRFDPAKLRPEAASAPAPVAPAPRRRKKPAGAPLLAVRGSSPYTATKAAAGDAPTSTDSLDTGE